MAVMLQVKVGLQLSSLKMPFRRAIQVASDLGAEAVEIDARGELKPQELSRTATRQIRKLLDNYNLTVSAVSFRTRRGYNVASDLEARIEATQEAMRLAFELGSRVVVNAIGRVPAEPQGTEWELLLQALSELGKASQKTGAMLAADTGSESGTDLARLLAALPTGSIGVNFNPGRLIVNGFSAQDAVKALGTSILHIHAQDGVRDLSQGRGLEVPLGQGSAEFPELLARLEEFQYRGYLTIVCEQATNPAFEIGQAMQYLRSL